MTRVAVLCVCIGMAGAVSAATVQVDLSLIFDRDTILGPDEPLDGSGGDFDGRDDDIGTGWTLLAEGWGGTAANPAANGPPEDGIVADYQLGPIDDLNAIHLCLDDEGTRTVIPVPAGRYEQVRFLVSVADGDADIPITFTYATGDDVDRLLLGGHRGADGAGFLLRRIR